MAAIKAIIAVCSIALAVRAGEPNPNTNSQTPTGTDSNTPVTTPPVTPPSPTINLILTDGSTVTETHECLKDFGPFRGAFEYATPSQQDSSGAYELALPLINSSADYARYKSLWAAGKEGEQGEDLTVDDFARFFNLAVYMDIQGDTCQRFGVNMVKRALLGKHSADIIKKLPPGGNFGQILFRHILLAFTEHFGYRAGVSDHAVVFYSMSAESAAGFKETMFGLEDLSKFKDNMKTRGITKARLFGCIPKDRSKVSIDCAAVFGWLLCHSELYSLSFSLGLEKPNGAGAFAPSADSVGSLHKDLTSITQLHRDRKVVIEGLDFLGCLLHFWNLDMLIHGHFQLKELKMQLDSELGQYGIESLESFAELEIVHIRGPSRGQPTSVVKQLTDKLPKLKGLAIDLGALGDIFAARTTPAGFSGCSNLERLEINGGSLSSAFVQNLPTYIPGVKSLKVQAHQLNNSVAASFAKCLNLETLVIGASPQTSSFVARLLENVPKIKSLAIRVVQLGIIAAASFKQCSNLERLELGENTQTSWFFQELLKNVPKIRSLKLKVAQLDGIVAVGFKKRPNIEVLELGGGTQTRWFFQELLKHVPKIKQLSIVVAQLNDAVAASFANFPNLEQLVIDGANQTSSFVARLLENAPAIKALAIRVEALDDTAVNGFLNCPRLDKLSLSGDAQTSSFVQQLVRNVPAARQLKLHVDVLSSDLGTALSKCSKLQELDLYGKRLSGFYASVLKAPLLNSLEKLEVLRRGGSQECSPEDKEATAEARQQGVDVRVY